MSQHTRKFTGATVNIVEADGWNQVSISVSSESTASATVLGTANSSNGTVSSEIDVEAGGSLSFYKQNDKPILLTITAPAGCTINLVCQ